MVKSLGGTWHCEGTALGDKTKATETTKAELDGFWVHASLAGGKVKLETFTTFDASDKKWHRVALANDGEALVGTGEPMKDMKMDFTLEGRGAQVREHLDASDLRRGLHAWAERSTDKGKTWLPVYDLLCRR